MSPPEIRELRRVLRHRNLMVREASKLAPRHNPLLAEVCEKAKVKGANHNRATLAVARKIVAYLMCVEKTGRAFVMGSEN